MTIRNNSFDLIRHCAAVAVLVSHQYALSGLEEPAIEGFTSLGGMALMSFFAISGLLITQSFINSSSIYSYLQKRAARIFPGLIACAFFMVFIIGSLFSTEGAGYVFSTKSVIDFIKISSFNRADIPSINGNFIFNENLNGSLWTLKIEFTFYIVIALCLSLLKGIRLPLAITAACCFSAYFSSHSEHLWAGRIQLYSMMGIAFFTGASLHYCRYLLATNQAKIALCASGLIIFFSSLQTAFTAVFTCTGFTIFILSAGSLFKDRLIKARFDISYGIYLYAFPIQQLLINKTDLSFVNSMLASLVLTTLLAYISWLFIEKPVLNYVHTHNKNRRSTTESA